MKLGDFQGESITNGLNNKRNTYKLRDFLQGLIFTVSLSITQILHGFFKTAPRYLLLQLEERGPFWLCHFQPSEKSFDISPNPKMAALRRILLLALLCLLVTSATADGKKKKGKGKGKKSVVTYDGRSLIINGSRELIFSGSIHYPRSPPEVIISNDYVQPPRLKACTEFKFCYMH